MHARSSITSHRHWSDLVQPSLDAAFLITSLAMIKWLARGYVDEMAVATSLIATVVFLLASQLTGLHRRTGTGSPNNEMASIVVTWGITVAVLAFLAFATRYGQFFARSLILIWLVLAPSMIGLGRMCLRIVQQGLLRRGIGVRQVAIAGLNDLGRQTLANINSDASLGMNVVGFFDDRNEPRQNSEEGTCTLRLSGDLNELIAAAKAGQIDTILITLPMRAEERIKFVLSELSDSTVSVYIVPDFFVFELLHSRWTNIGGLPTVSVFENPLFGVDGVAKRTVDIVVAIAALVIAAIPMLCVAIAVKFSSPGPVFFRQKRYGLDGREILVWKFRSMRTCDNGPVIKQATKGDPRITRVGELIRKTSLDELPQLFNVISGRMSLVGPRPHASAHNEQYRSLIRGYMLRHKVKPGITGLAQVNGCRGETDTIDKMERRIEMDHEYIRRWSVWLDLKILVKTLFVAWRQPEAH